MASGETSGNRLGGETSPYLLQHAGNPVHWLPWGDEAFRRAREEGKPVFLSVGYSTCHWCHVMERESFENMEVADLLNREFISVKVDREERPDVDRAYMAYVQATTGAGGWPMSVWLTPGGRPFYGGTYFPPEDRHGRPGFRSLLENIAGLWRGRREEIEGHGAGVVEALRGQAGPRGGKGGGVPLELATGRAAEGFLAMLDGEHGGFGGAPKFPRPSVFMFLHREAGRRAFRGDSYGGMLEASLDSLRAICCGGIHDHLDGGFHRYSVDRYWHVPHFEKMLYDQAQMALALSDAMRITGESVFGHALRGVCDYVLGRLCGHGGGFLSAEDADSLDPATGESGEGAYYLWTADEVRRLLAEGDAEGFCRAYGVVGAGNIRAESDPHGEMAGKNVLYAAEASVFGEPARFGVERQLLLDARSMRPPPHCDDKVVAAWNGLMIGGLAHAGEVLGETRYIDAAERAARFLDEAMTVRDADGLVLCRSWRERPSGAEGFAEDYAACAFGLLQLFKTTGDGAHLERALEYQRTLDRSFAAEGGGYHGSVDDPLLPLRLRGDHDGAEPCADSLAFGNLLELAVLTGEEDYRRKALDIAASHGSILSSGATALPWMLAWSSLADGDGPLVVLQGDPRSDAGVALRKAMAGTFLAGGLAVHFPQVGGVGGAGALCGMVSAMGEPSRGATAHVCEGFSCGLPVDDAETLCERLAPWRLRHGE